MWTNLADVTQLQLVVSVDHGDLLFVKPPDIARTLDDGWEIPREDLNLKILRVQAPVLGMCFSPMQPGAAGGTHVLTAFTSDKKVSQLLI